LCLPIIFIGPATAGFAHLMRNFATSRPVFVVSDFKDTFKENLI
jgi:uncharacterized membrane protein YesL